MIRERVGVDLPLNLGRGPISKTDLFGDGDALFNEIVCVLSFLFVLLRFPPDDEGSSCSILISVNADKTNVIDIFKS